MRDYFFVFTLAVVSGERANSFSTLHHRAKHRIPEFVLPTRTEYGMYLITGFCERTHRHTHLISGFKVSFDAIPSVIYIPQPKQPKHTSRWQ